MSVLIKDMEMPKYCLECPFEDSPEFDCYCIAGGYEFIGEWEGLGAYKPDWCPLEEPKTGEWIPVSERLPKMNEYVDDVCKCYLIQDEYGDMHVAHLGGRGWEPMESITALECDVVAWMSLPEPHRKDGEE